MEFQCFEIQIKTEADSNDSNECPHDDKPSTGMFAVSDDMKRCVRKLSKSQKVDLRKSPLKLWKCKRLKFNQNLA